MAGSRLPSALIFFLALSIAAPTALASPASEPNTPRAALREFIDSARDGDYRRAAARLDLQALPPELRAEQGPRLARQLKFVLDQKLWIDWDRISDERNGDPADGPDGDVIGEIETSTGRAPITLTRDDGTGQWRISRGTVERIPSLYAEHGAGWIGVHVPAVLMKIRILEVEAWQWLGILAALLLAWLMGVVIARLATGIASRIARRTNTTWGERLVTVSQGPMKLFVALAALGALVEPLHLSIPARSAIDHGRKTLLVVALAWLAMRLVSFLADTLHDVLLAGTEDEAKKRGIRTQVAVMRRVAGVLVMIVSSALVLTQFEVVRNVGMSLLASAGIAGIVIGLAAQKSIATLLAGIQLSITQPIRIGDTVIIENEWGWIEEIHLTYVVVKVWDLRRLVIPINKFLDSPFQNWTKVPTNLLGTVMLYVDYATPLDQVRAELERLCKPHPCWDGKVCGLQVTDVSERTMTLRALVSSEDSGKNWDLRCDVREGLVTFLQKLENGRYLPKARVEVEADRDASMAATAAAASAHLRG